MDPQQQARDYSGANPQRVGTNYNYHGMQNDPFHTFVNTENESAFEPSWSNPPIPAQQQQINGFDEGSNGWQQTPYQSSNFLSAANYGPPRDYEQPYSRSPSSFNYSGFEPSNNQTFAPNTYETHPTSYEDPLYGSMNNDTQFNYPGSAELQQHNETISPQALQTYPSTLTQSAPDGSHQSHHTHHLTDLPLRRMSTGGPGMHTGPDWVGLATATSPSFAARGLHIKPTTGLSNATKSTRIDGFVFVGTGKQSSGPIRVKVTRNERKRSLKGIRRMFELEGGNETFTPDREHLMKKIKLTESKLGSRPKKSASGSEPSDSESEDDSVYESDSDLEVQLEEPSPLPAARPADPNKAVEYDVIKAVWAKKSVGLSSTVIRSALSDIWNIFKGIREKWKAKATNLQQAIEKKDLANTKAYERRVLEQRRLLESCVGLTLKHGHPDIIEKLGENPAFLLVFYQFLADRFKDSEYTSSFIAIILELLTRCVTVDQSMLEKTKLDKILPRLVKRGDDQGKAFAQKILDNAADISKTKTIDGKGGQNQQSNGVLPGSGSDSKAIKREAPDDDRESLDVASKGAKLVKTAKPANGAVSGQSPAKADSKSTTKTAGSDASSIKLKTNQITAKPTGFFTGLKSASKKPGTSVKLEAGKASATSVSKAEPTPAPPKAGFSFAATMAALDAQKEAPPVKVQESRKPETAEERRKRLRKEERRKLRVSFKGDEDLVQVREFIHDPEEELGHEDSQVRDVKDTRGEGQMLKMHKDLDLDDDEDYEPPEEIVLPEWNVPHSTDFSVVDEEQLARNYSNRGGRKEIESEERAAQEQRELSTLMVVYTNHSDIPFSPREPSDPFSGESVKEESFGAPSEETQVYRDRPFKEKRTPSLHFDSQKRDAAANARRKPANPPMPDIANLLRIMQGQNQAQPPPQQPPQQPPPPVAAPNALEAIFAQFNNSPQQPAPAVQQPPQQPTSGLDFQTILAGMPPSGQAQPGFGAPPPPQVNIQAILAQMGNQPASQAPQMQSYGYGDQPQTENDRKRPYDQGDGDYTRKRTRSGGGPSGNLPYKVQICKYWKDGKCRWGDGCSYIHE